MSNFCHFKEQSLLGTDGGLSFLFQFLFCSTTSLKLGKIMSNFCHFKEQSLQNLTSAFQHQTQVCSFPDLCWQFMSQLKCAWEVQIVVAQLCSYFYFPLGEMMSNFCSFLEYSPQNLTSVFQKKTQMCLFPDLCQQFLSIKSKCSWFNKFLLFSFVVVFICHFS